MHRFKVKLWPEKAKIEKINLEQTIETVTSIADEYSDEGRRATNRKWIEQDSIKITGDCIELILCSEAWLNFPTKALRGFISKLSKSSEYNGLITTSGRLFKGESEYLEEDILEEELTDEQVLIAVTKLFFRETEENRKKINQIKEIIGGSENV